MAEGDNKQPVDDQIVAAVPAVDAVAPAAEPVAAAEATPAAIPAVAAEPAPAAASTPEATPAAPASEPSLLQTVDKDKKAAEAKPAEAKPADAPAADAKPAEPAEDAAPAAETKPAEPAKPEPVDYKYTLPDTFKMDDALKGDVHKALDDFRANPAEGAQKLMDLHVKTMQDYDAHLKNEQRRVFNDTRKEWRTGIMADPELGGAGFNTTAGAVARMRDMLVPNKFLQPRKFDDGSARLSEFDEFLETTGAGDHPMLWHLLHNAARYLDEPQAKDLPANPRPAKVKSPRGSIYSEDSRAKMNGKT